MNEHHDGKKHIQKQRFTSNKMIQVGSYDHNVSYNGEGDTHTNSNEALINDAATRKYSSEFLKTVGHQYSMMSNPNTIKNRHLIEDQNLLIKLKFGDNSHIFNSLGQPHQYQHQRNYLRYQQQQLHQRMELYHRHDQQNNYQRNPLVHQNVSNNRMFNNNNSSNNNNNANSNRQSKTESELSHHFQQQTRDMHSYQNNGYYQQSMFQQSNSNNATYQNRGKHNYKKNRNQTNQMNGGVSNERYNNGNNKRSTNERIINASKSENNIQDESEMDKNLMITRANSDDSKYRSISPIPPSSVKSIHNYKKNRNHPNHTNVVGNNERYNNSNNESSSNEHIINALKSENNIQDESQMHKNLMIVPANPDDCKHQNLSQTPGIVEKTIESKEGSNECADDTESTASASSGPSVFSYSSDTGKIKPSILLTTPNDQERKENSVNSWINNNNFGMVRNGLSASAEQLNMRVSEIPLQIIKRPPSANEISTPQTNHNQNFAITRQLTMPYDPVYPFDYYFARSDHIEMRIEPSNLKCGTVWDVLSKQMWDRFQTFQQTRDTYRSKMLLWKELYDYVKGFPLFQQRAFSKWGLFLVGSTITGFGLDSSDVDMCLVLRTAPQLDPRTEAMITLSTLRSYLMNSGSSFQAFSLINAKVPILRFRDVTNKIEVDLNYNNCIGVRNTHLLHCYAQLDWRLRPLAIIVKLWAQYHNINDARNSTISSYSLVLMVIHFLQYACAKPVLPCLHKMYPEKFKLHDITTIDMMETLNTKWQSENQQSLGELFLRFLDYYSNFNYLRNAISIRTGGILPIEECKNVKNLKNDPNHWQTLCIEEPFDFTNTARSTYDGEIFEKIKGVFRQSMYRLREHKTLDVLFQDPLFVHQLNTTQYQQAQQQQSQTFHQVNTQMLNYIIYNPPKATQLISTSPMNEIVS
ncbi:hypothetical protein PVAND_003120 [Polypedilum vanderplanki]|uniref:Uncharacterized protein n=1 Tax=Polypedilum vanderplanki TaxID=319348 RepID=A0A9J6BTH9_POLVA|nr:hypothetical protein PVAND_003120 [Polypedilum vanderplanki]